MQRPLVVGRAKGLARPDLVFNFDISGLAPRQKSRLRLSHAHDRDTV